MPHPIQRSRVSTACHNFPIICKYSAIGYVPVIACIQHLLRSRCSRKLLGLLLYLPQAELSRGKRRYCAGNSTLNISLHYSLNDRFVGRSVLWESDMDMPFSISTKHKWLNLNVKLAIFLRPLIDYRLSDTRPASSCSSANSLR